jgi:hypothetical protein
MHDGGRTKTIVKLSRNMIYIQVERTQSKQTSKKELKRKEY